MEKLIKFVESGGGCSLTQVCPKRGPGATCGPLNNSVQPLTAAQYWYKFDPFNDKLDSSLMGSVTHKVFLFLFHSNYRCKHT